MTDPFVVVGGDAAGLSAASKCKREAPEREVVVFERGRWVSYAHCGTPYFVEGVVDRLDDLLALSPEEIAGRGIDLRRTHEVVDLHPGRQTVTVRGPGGEFDQPYGDLLVATGAHAVSDPIEGSHLDGVETMHGLDAAARVRATLLDPETGSLEDVGGEPYVDTAAVEHCLAMEPPETVAVVGGGYVGVEMAEAFSAHDLEVHLFQRPDRLLSAFGEPVGRRVEETLADEGVTLHLGQEVDRIVGDGRIERLVCRGGSTLSAQLALVGIGVRPNTELVEDTDVDLGAGGAIAVDDYGRTTVDSVYAAGDCATDRHAVTGADAWVPLGLTANRAGRAVGATVAGDPEPVGDVAGTAVVKAFDLECGRSGIVVDEAAHEAGFDPVSKTITAPSRSSYYPGAAETTVTLTADRESGRLIGGSVVGTDRAAVRINPVATALDQGLTVAEVERLDLGYAPPFSPVWDPVLVAAKVLNGALE